MKPARSMSCSTVEDLLVRYLMGSLSREERAAVENHLRSCPECSREREEAEKMIRPMDDYEDAFCPDPEEIYEFTKYSVDPNAKIATHVKRCAPCREAAQEYTFLPRGTIMPEEVWKGVKRQFAVQDSSQAPFERETLVSRILGWLSSLLKLPVAAMATAAAVGLLVFIFYPGKVPAPMIGLSTMTWGDHGGEIVLKAGRRIPGRDRVAHIIMFEGFTAPPSQEKIDRLYRALKPSPEMDKRCEFVTPAAMMEAFEKEEIASKSREEILPELFSKLGIGKAIVSSIIFKDGHFSVKSDLVDTGTGKIQGQDVKQEVPEAELPSTLREAAYTALGEQAGSR